MTTGDSSTRLQSKQLTRQGLIRAALKLLSQHSFDSLSLRQVTRQAGITPTAFYRHFDDMEELGLVLVDESFRSLGAMLAEARTQASLGSSSGGAGSSGSSGPSGSTIDRSLAVVLHHLHQHTAHFRFVARERNGGVRRLRRAINRELQLVADELAIDLAVLPGAARWSTDDRRMLAGLITETIIRMVTEILEYGPESEEEQAIVARTTRQLRFIIQGVRGWDGALGDGAVAGSRA